jgi:hypothetical protein
MFRRKREKPKRDANRDPAETPTFIVVGIVLFAVPALVFFFSFGNVGLLGVSLGVDHWIAFLTGPAVDLSVAGSVIAASYLSSHGWTEKRLWPLHVAALVCGLVMIALNDGQAIYEHRWRLACFDAVGPMLLIGLGAIGPWLLRQLAEAKRIPFRATHGNPVAATGGSVATTVDRLVAATRPATLEAVAPATEHEIEAKLQQPAAAQPRKTEASGNGSVTTLIPASERLKIVRQIVAEQGADVPLAVIIERLGCHKSTASRLRSSATSEPEAGGESDQTEDDPDREGAA